MDYEIFLDGEKCGELTEAEHKRLRKEVRADPWTWVHFACAQVWGVLKFFTFYMRWLGALGGIGTLMLLLFAPQIVQAIENMPLAEVATALRTFGFSLTLFGAMVSVVTLMFFPQVLEIPSVMKLGFIKKVRRLKGIRRYGTVEVEQKITLGTDNTQEAQ